jgi:hypothetical protein
MTGRPTRQPTLNGLSRLMPRPRVDALARPASSQVAPTPRGQADAALFGELFLREPAALSDGFDFHGHAFPGTICTLSGTVGQRASALDLAGTMVAVSLPGYLVPMQPMLGQPFHRSGWIYEEK